MSEIISNQEAAPEKVFTIGLAMAGAISAGAYTAGVMDTLFLALAAHQRKFEAGEVGYRVVLKVMSGSSAGGICSALGAMALAEGVREIDPDQPAPEPPGDNIPDADAAHHVGLPLLYELWVKRLNLLSGPGTDANRRDPEIDGLLSLTDLIEEGANVRSILDSSFIDSQAQALLKERIRSGTPRKLGYVAADLDVFLTTTNLMGVPYEVKFSGEEGSGHLMASHSVVTHFRLTGIGAAEIGSHWLEQWEDHGVPLSLTEASGTTIDFTGETKRDEGWKALLDTAVGSGAFPIGLSSRPLVMQSAQLHSQAWVIDAPPDSRPEVKLPTTLSRDDDLPYVAVDGGVANNEPFELARFTLRPARAEAMDRRIAYLEEFGTTDAHSEEAALLRLRRPHVEPWQLGRNPRGANNADRAVIMIDPFPEGPQLRPAAADDENARIEAGMVFAGKKLLPSLINQSRFKPGELMNATDDRIHSRFLVSPSRTLTSDPRTIKAVLNEEGEAGTASIDDRLPKRLRLSGAAAIASGFVGGFGGFFSAYFREHDYRLGQKNCRSFLENYFVIGEANATFADETALKRPERGRGGNPEMVRILQFEGHDLPDLSSRFRDPHELPPISGAEIDEAVSRIRRRVERAGLRLVQGSGLPFAAQVLIDQAWNGFGWPKSRRLRATNGLRHQVLQALERTLLADLAVRRQSERAMAMDDAQRALYVGLLRQGGKEATPDEIAEKSTIIPSLDRRMLAELGPGERRDAKSFRLRSQIEVLRQIRENDKLSGIAKLKIKRITPVGRQGPSQYILKE